MIQSGTGYGTRVLFLAVNGWMLLRHPVNVVRFRWVLGYWPNVATPHRYNEKALWRKLFDRNPVFGVLCDKLKARNAFADLAPGIRLTRLLWHAQRP